MYFIIIGCGRLGEQLTSILMNEKHEVAVIEKDPDICKWMVKNSRALVVQGDGTKKEFLKEANAERADSVISVTGLDETNIMACLMAKQEGAKIVAARLSKTDYGEEFLEKLNLDLVVYPEAAAAAYISELVTNPEVLDFALFSGGKTELVELEVKPTSKLIGLSVMNVNTPKDVELVALYKKEELIKADDKTIIEPGDRLILIGDTEKIKGVKRIIGA